MSRALRKKAFQRPGPARTNLRLAREAAPIQIEYPGELPIAAARERIATALREHSVIVVAGDTGSGKTTQLPKICLEAGLGIRGMIGHTQPRRIAARSVARRIASELGTTVGEAVGLKLRFTDRTSAATRLKLMTDGILLNEIRADRWLRRYDALIIDEAHERSLNIDFLLGYLKRVLGKRRDLKLIVTSATIDPGRFAAHFDAAPVIEVEGRNHPVDVQYVPRSKGQTLGDAIAAAATELAENGLEGLASASGQAGYRDMLVFLPGERWIREAEQSLHRHGPKGFDILPLYARLPESRQDRIFAPGEAPRIILATNVAETSLTVPRIRFVIDTGLARISRYAARHRFQGLRVEPIAQANAIQRAGRCGRTAPGRCIRLYARDDFDARPAFAEPEILRTNLAGVILQLEALGLGGVDAFAFPDAPPSTMVNDAYRLLRLLGALDSRGRLTKTGRLMARMPVEPRVARLLCSAQQNGSLREALVIAAALSVADPREHTADTRGKAPEQQAKLADRDSDFVSYLNLWRVLRHQRSHGTAALRRWCEQHYVSFNRLLEWEDVHAQLREFARDLGWRENRRPASYRQIHEPILAAFVDFLGERVERGRYRGINEAAARIFPASSLADRSPRWIVAAERLALEEQYVGTVAKINPRWLLDVAPHLVDREYVEPAWSERRQRVEANEIMKLMGFVIGQGRRVDYANIDPAAARRIFIREALVRDAIASPPAIILENREICATVLDWEARLRRRDLFVGEPGLAAFYEQRLPENVHGLRALESYCAEPEQAATLRLTTADVATRELRPQELDERPDALSLAGQTLPLSYVYDPASERDGVSLSLPAGLLETVGPEIVDWLIPGWLHEKITQLLRLLPKDLRRRLVPIPDTARALHPLLAPLRGRERLSDALSRALRDAYDLDVDARVFDCRALPRHLNMRVAIEGIEAPALDADRDFAARRLQLLNEAARGRPNELPGGAAWSRRNITPAELIDLPDSVTIAEGRRQWTLYPCLYASQGRVDLGLRPPSAAARAGHGRAAVELILKSLPQQVSAIRKELARDRDLLLMYHGVGHERDLALDVLRAAAVASFPGCVGIRSRADFDSVLSAGRAHFVDNAVELATLLRSLLPKYRQIRSELADTQSPRARRVRAAAIEDIEQQLGGLVHAHFLCATPAPWRGHLPRYLEAIELRWQKLGHQHAKDADYQKSVEIAWQRLVSWRRSLPDRWPWPAAAVRYRWLVEEFRVSLFAQSLGTALPISAKRLAAAWDDVRSSPVAYEDNTLNIYSNYL